MGTSSSPFASSAKRSTADPTAIYRHFRSRDELLRAMGDRCLAGVVDDLPTASWRDCIRELCIRIRAANLAQPALATVGARRSPTTRQRVADHRDDPRSAARRRLRR